MRLALLLAPLAALVATPSAAADLAGIDCPLAALNPTQRDAVAEAMIVSTTPISDPRLGALRAAAENCARQLGWSARATGYATSYHAGSLARDVLRQRLVAAGVDLAPLESAILADRELLAAVESGSYDENVLSAFAARHMELIMRTLGDHPPQVQTWVGNFSGFVVSAHAMRRNFIAN